MDIILNCKFRMSNETQMSECFKIETLKIYSKLTIQISILMEGI